jgi:hypothetical protein
MPTNKLWLEHTEKAAWESVQALREKLADAERRMQRLAPPTGGWQALLDALDAAKTELGLSAETYAQLLSELVSESKRAHSERRAIERELNDLRSQSLMREITTTPSARRPRLDSGIDDDVRPLTPPREEILVKFMRRYEAAQREAHGDLEELFESLDGKLADLADLDERALPDAALELAAELLCAAKSAQRSAR